jgi:DNA-binding MarR family transcriptional regulator
MTTDNQTHDQRYNALLAKIEATMAHEHFQRAAACYFSEFNRTAINNRYILKLASDEGRYAVFIKIVAMLISSNQTRKLTITMVQSFAEEHRLCSRNRVTMIINAAEFFGYLSRINDAKDRRSRTIVATPKFQSLFEDGFRYFSQPMAILDPEKSRLIPISNSELCAAFITEAIDLYLGEMRFGLILPELAPLADREGALEIFARLLVEANYFTDAQRTTVDLPYSRISGDLMLSRSHVQKFFAILSEREIVRLGRPGGREIEILAKGDLVARQVAASFLTVFQTAAGNVLRQRGLLDALPATSPS